MSKFTKSAILATSALLFSAGASAQFSAGQSPEALKAEISAQAGRGVSMDAMLAAATAAKVDLKTFVSAASKAGIPVSSIATAVLSASAVPSDALKVLGEVFAGNQEALETIFTTALSLPSLMLRPEVVESSIEAGCGRDCLSANVVARLTAPTLLRKEQTRTPTSSFTSTTNTGGGSGPKRSISPTS